MSRPRWGGWRWFLALWILISGGCTKAYVSSGEVSSDSLFTIDPVASVVCTSLLVLSGGKDGEVAISIDGEEVVPADGKTTWTAYVDLTEGENEIRVTGNRFALEHEEVVTVSYLETPPEAPAVEAPGTTTSRNIEVTGTKPAGTGIVRDAVLIAGVDETTVFSDTLALDAGENVFFYRSRDVCDRDSYAVRVAISFTEVPFTVDELPALMCTSLLTVSGSKAETVSISVNGEAATVTGGDTSWTAQVELMEGVNEIHVTGTQGTASREEVFLLRYAQTAPEPPVLEAPSATTSATLGVGGTKPADTGIVRNGVLVVAVDETTAFVDTLSLVAGVNTFYYRTRDGCDRESGEVRVELFFDDTPAAATLFYPEAGEVVGRGVAVKGRATDDQGVSSVGVCIGACLSGSDFALVGGSDPFEGVVDTSQLAAAQDGTLVDLAVQVTNGLGLTFEAVRFQVYLLREPKALSGEEKFTENTAWPDIAVGPERDLYAVFQDASVENDDDVYLSVQDGSAFETTSILVTDNNTSYANSNTPQVAWVASGEIHVIWRDDGPLVSSQASQFGLAHRILDAAGLSEPQVVLTSAAGTVADPDLAAGGDGTVTAVWRRNDAIELAQYDGLSWGDPVTVSDAGLSVDARAAQVVVSDDGVVHVLWQDRGTLDGDAEVDWDIYYRRYDPSLVVADPAEGLSALVLVTASETGFVDGSSTKPSIAAVRSDPTHLVYAAWIEDGSVAGAGSGTAQAVIRALDDGVFDTPRALGEIVNVSAVPGHVLAVSTSIAANDLGNLSIAWVDRDGDIAGSGSDRDVFLRRFDGSLLDGFPISDLDGNTVSTGRSTNAVVGLDTLGNSHVVWVEESDLTGTISGDTDTDVLYFGVGWSGP